MLSGKENLMGSQYDDTRMGDGNDNVLVGAGGHDTIIGGAGSDTVSYASASASVTVNLQIGSGSGGDAEGDTYIDIENVIGSSYGDRSEERSVGKACVSTCKSRVSP